MGEGMSLCITGLHDWPTAWSEWLQDSVIRWWPSTAHTTTSSSSRQFVSKQTTFFQVLLVCTTVAMMSPSLPHHCCMAITMQNILEWGTTLREHISCHRRQLMLRLLLMCTTCLHNRVTSAVSCPSFIRGWNVDIYAGLVQVVLYSRPILRAYSWHHCCDILQ